ncbi:hypothetical protein ACQKJZ_11395 [Sphingomonas sp. NPDC019816]|uniref:hypothetical protein n=1 Tax=Sphingomonas sp. NPDC019816 TaxID=3390679 RepID=UPI003CFCB677
MVMIPPPSKTLWVAELPRALWMGATWWWHRANLAAVARGDGRTVMLLTGKRIDDPAVVARSAAIAGPLPFSDQ